MPTYIERIEELAEAAVKEPELVRSALESLQKVLRMAEDLGLRPLGIEAIERTADHLVAALARAGER